MIQVGDLVRLRHPFPDQGDQLGLVIAIGPDDPLVPHFMLPVEVLIADKHWNFIVYALEAV